MVARLRLAGVRPISLAVDITNYVMFELGQPIHGYDLDKLSGGLVVRRASAGEKLTTLDGVERTLNAEDLLITDGSGPIGLAGVMGGASTEISDATTNVLIEAANFDPVSIARTARRHKLPSEASKRFERGVDPAVAEVAAGRVVQLLVDLAGGTVADHGSRWSSSTDGEYRGHAIELPAGFVSDLIGYDYTPEQVRSTLAEIGGIVIDGRVDPQGGIETFIVTPPSWRPDLTDKWTLAEEVARIFGYDVIPASLPVAPPGRGYTVAQVVRRRVSDALAAAGLTETLSYPFFDEATNNLFGSPAGTDVPQVRLANALDVSQGWMRTSLLPGLLQTAARNRARGLTSPAIFELGLVFKPEAGKKYGHEMFPGAVRPTDSQLAAVAAGLPPQPRHIAAVLVGESIERQPGLKASEFDYSHALEVAQQIWLGAGVEISVRQGHHANFHPGRCAELFVRSSSSLVRSSSSAEGAYRDEDIVIGYAGEILPAVAESFNLPRRVAAIELNLDAVTALAGNPAEAQLLFTMPAATQDLSLVVKSDIPADAVLAAVVAGAGDLLEDARLVDIYEGQGVADGHRSLTFALRFRASDRTLTQAEATEAKQAGVAAATAAFGATIRE
jgi:phenylalanyl-tRNA synthetase beta chain